MQKQRAVLLEGKVVNFKIRAQYVAFNETADWLIGVKFQCGFKVRKRCATPCLYHVQENHLIPSKFRKY